MGANVGSQFSALFAPTLWEQQLAMFGRTVQYRQVSDLNTPLELQGVWKEGFADEAVSPGRYSILVVRNSDLPGGGPQKSDQVTNGSDVYTVVSVSADALGFSALTMKKSGALEEGGGRRRRTPWEP